MDDIEEKRDAWLDRGVDVLAFVNGFMACVYTVVGIRRPWGWWLGLGAAGLSLVLAILDAVKRAWGAAAFDFGFAALAAACLLALRARACIRAQDR